MGKDDLNDRIAKAQAKIDAQNAPLTLSTGKGMGLGFRMASDFAAAVIVGVVLGLGIDAIFKVSPWGGHRLPPARVRSRRQECRGNRDEGQSGRRNDEGRRRQRMMVSTDPMHQFKIEKLLDLQLGGLDISFTTSAMWMVIAGVLVLIGVLALATAEHEDRPSPHAVAGRDLVLVHRRHREGREPRAGQALRPAGVHALLVHLHRQHPRACVPYRFTTTSHIAVTGFMAIFTIGLVVLVGIIKKGFGFLKIFVPSGVPFVLLLIVTPIEIISFLSRPISLGMRLFANMLGGHVALKVFAGFVPLARRRPWRHRHADGRIARDAVGRWCASALEFLVAFPPGLRVLPCSPCVYLNDALGGRTH